MPSLAQTTELPVYQISVSGFLDDSWSSRLGGMSFDHQLISDKTITTLTGQLTDQAALNGVLNTLFNHQLEVLSVVKIK